MTSAEFETAAVELLKNRSNVHHVVFGESCLGRPLSAFVIGEGAKSVLINAAHHANEWITTPLLFRFMEEIAEESLKNPELLKNVMLHFIPLVNPDGADLVIHSGGRFNGWKANICGVDLNSNYPANWHKAREHKFSRGYTKPGARDFVGEKALSEPESCAMAAYTTFFDIDITVSLHTQGEEIYHKYMDFNPPGADDLARRFAAASGYALTNVPDESSHGGYRDWFISKFNRPGFTIECGLGESPLPLSQFDDIYVKVSALLRELFADTHENANARI
ncbi:MAG: M14 family metallocarboxypeptidase [Defluviitaleaceae bacterium]|nr:M14 family metallocarboxypeptidase [Defluviitaleaceae bacterium]